MDVESLAKQLILKGMTEEQQKAVLMSIRESVQKTRELQKQKVGENAQLVIQALKKIESDIRDRYDDLGNKIESRVRSIKDGKDGKDGRNGANGRDGRDGSMGPMGPKGKDGLNGRDGKDGEDGVSVTDAHIDFDGSLIISLSSGRTINVGEVVAPDLAEKIKVITNGGGTSQSVLDTLASLQTQINNLIPSQTGQAGKYLTTNGSVLSWASVAGNLSYQGTWNASANTPTLASGVGTNGYYYIVATAGSTNLDGITDWQIGDWLMFNGTVWQKIDQSNLVTSVNSQTGAVVLTTTNINEGTNQYYLDSRARSALSAGTGISYSTSTGVITNSAPDQTVALTAGTGISTSGTYPNFTITNSDRGSSQNIFKNVAVAGQNTVVADTNDDTLTLASGTGITITTNDSTDTVTITNSAPDQTVSLTGAGTTSISGTYPNFTVTSNDQYVGTVTSVGGTGTVNGITLSGTVTSSGNLTLGGTLSGVSLATQVTGTLPIANGGTGQTTANAAFNALAPSQSSQSGKYLTTDGTNTSWSTVNLPNTFGFKNRIINGNMVIDQRNAGAAVTTSSAFPVDRFTQAFGNASCSFQQVSDAPSGFTNSLRLTVTTGAAPSAGTNNVILQRIEGLNVADLAWGTASASSVTLSFWVKASVTGTYAVAFTNSAFNRSYVQTYVVNSANVWEQKTVSLSGDTTGTWLTTNGTGLIVLWDFGSGSNLNTTAGAWQAGNFYRTSACTTIVGTTNATLAITGVQLEKGSTDTSFDYRPYGTELMLCQRYYERLTAPLYGAYAPSGGVGYLQWYYKVTKRATPTVTLVGGSVLTIDSTTPDFVQGYRAALAYPFIDTGSTASIEL